MLSAEDLNQLAELAERKRRGDQQDETAFYDLTAVSRILPVLYSQRYEYFLEVGVRVLSRIGVANRVLDFGCGAGILTTFYARHCPDTQFVGIDRSPGSIAAAQSKAAELGLRNVRFECRDMEVEALDGSYECIISTHAMVQAEQEPGLPSLSWTTFERAQQEGQQAAFEQRTGIGVRVDRLIGMLSSGGRLVIFEKTRQLARRVPFQRALARRGIQLVEPPEAVRYRLVEEVADDGPFFVVQQGASHSYAWNEEPEPDEGLPFNRAMRRSAPHDPHIPLYENHWPSAQGVWEKLTDRLVRQEETRGEADGRQLHVELGSAEGLIYLYCANTFDQRQLILVEERRSGMLESYYREILAS